MKSLFKGGRSRGNRGMTLVEIMVSTGVGSLVLLSIMMVFATSNRTFVGMGNYVLMEQASRNAVDQRTRDIRKSKNLTRYSPSQLVFNFDGLNQLAYSYAPLARRLSQWKTGGETNVLLSGCDSLNFSMFSNIPQPGGVFTNTTIVAQGKSIGLGWKCSRTILGQKFNTEDMQQALIV